MRTPPIVIVALACLTLTGCDQKLSSLAGPTPDLEPTFASVQSQIFESTDVAGRQACVNCHTNVGRNPSGGLNPAHAVAYDQIVECREPPRKPGAIRVIPGDPENSYLVQKLEGQRWHRRRPHAAKRPAVPDRRTDPDSQTLDRARRTTQLTVRSRCDTSIRYPPVLRPLGAAPAPAGRLCAARRRRGTEAG